MTVPASWVKSTRTDGNYKTTVKRTHCCWPKAGSADEKKVRHLIRECSDPDEENWLFLEGSLKGFFDNYKEAERYITDKLGTESTETELERLLTIGDRAAQQEKQSKGKKLMVKTPLQPLNTPLSNVSPNHREDNHCTPSVAPSTSGVYIYSFHMITQLNSITEFWVPGISLCQVLVATVFLTW